MAAHPDELDLMRLERRGEALPEIHVLHRLLAGRAPVPPLPVVDPGGDAVAHVAAVGVETDTAGPGQRLERHDRRHQLHAVVGGAGFETRELALLPAVAQDRAPTAGPGIAAAGAVR